MTLPAGKYYIGDPCYVIRGVDYERWTKFCDVLHEVCDGGPIVEFEGIPMFADGTAHGDGTYLDNEDNEYGVDAGLIGAVPVELIDDEDGIELGRIVTFSEPFEVDRSAEGMFQFGNIEIETDWTE